MENMRIDFLQYIEAFPPQDVQNMAMYLGYIVKASF